MMDIEFRGNIKSTGKWVHGDLIHYNRETTLIAGGWDYNWNEERRIYEFYAEEVIPETVGQYTGLNDKNGEKIFEGDIIISNGRDKSRYEVKIGEFSPCLFNAFLKEMELRADYKIIGVFAKSLDNKDIVGEECFIPIPNKVEVIGNIHDNPELLEADRDRN